MEIKERIKDLKRMNRELDIEIDEYLRQEFDALTNLKARRQVIKENIEEIEDLRIQLEGNNVVC